MPPITPSEAAQSAHIAPVANATEKNEGISGTFSSRIARLDTSGNPRTMRTMSLTQKLFYRSINGRLPTRPYGLVDEQKAQYLDLVGEELPETAGDDPESNSEFSQFINNPTLYKRLEINACNLSTRHLQRLLPALFSADNLKELTLNGLSIPGDDYVHHVDNQVSTDLDFSEVIKVLTERLMNESLTEIPLCNLERFELSNGTLNVKTDESLRREEKPLLQRFLEKHPSIKTLTFDHMRINASDVRAILESARNHPNLSFICLQNAHLHSDFPESGRVRQELYTLKDEINHERESKGLRRITMNLSQDIHQGGDPNDGFLPVFNLEL